MEMLQSFLDQLYNMWVAFWQLPYALWIAIAVMAEIVLIIIAAAVHRHKKKKAIKEEPPKGREYAFLGATTRPKKDAETPLEPVLPLSMVRPNNLYKTSPSTLNVVPGGEVSYPSLVRKLKAHKGVLSESLEAECVAVGADLLPDLVAVFKELDPRLAQNLKDLSEEKGWLVTYAHKLAEPDKSKERFLALWQVFPDTNALPHLVELLAHKDEHVRMDGVWLLTTIGDKRSLPHLVSALLQPQKYLTARVGEVFVTFDMDAANLLSGLLPELGEQNKLVVLETLAQFSGGYLLMPLVDCLNEHNWELRAAVVRTLGESDYYEAKEAIMPLTYDSMHQVRAAAAKALGQLKVQESRDRLRQLLVDEDFLVRANAKEALDRLELEY